MNKKIRRVLRFCFYAPWTFVNRIKYVMNHAQTGKGHETFGYVNLSNKGILTMGNDVRINSTKGKHPIGAGYRTYLKVKKGAVLKIGHNTRMSNVAIITGKSIQIGNHVRLGGGVMIFDTDFHSLDPFERTASPERGVVKTEPIVIKDYVFIGAEALILKGVTIGEAAVIGARAVVTKNVPDYEIWAGNPAKKVGDVPRR